MPKKKKCKCQCACACLSVINRSHRTRIEKAKKGGKKKKAGSKKKAGGGASAAQSFGLWNARFAISEAARKEHRANASVLISENQRLQDKIQNVCILTPFLCLRKKTKHKVLTHPIVYTTKV